MTDNVPLAKQLKKDVDAFLDTLRVGPDGTSSHNVGRGCICWLCGHVGIPKNVDKCSKGQKAAGICGMCEEDAQTNFVRLEQPQAPGEAARYIPWMQVKSRATEAEIAAAGALEK
mmetsp:Transcript_41455/g.94388  ORF Transcript_41455/g.94388 Transcript_41455/m.94388 type:complete len:115 (+) Transcript_41455:146-490(+)